MKTANPGKKPSKIRQMFGSRFKAGSYSAFAAAVVIAIAVLANLAVQALPQTATQIDLTAQSLYTLSDQTRRIAASLDTDVNLYLLALRGNEDDTISRLLQSYAELNSHIHVSNVDPTEQPTFLDAYDLDINQLYANSVLVDGRLTRSCVTLVRRQRTQPSGQLQRHLCDRLQHELQYLPVRYLHQL